LWSHVNAEKNCRKKTQKNEGGGLSGVFSVSIEPPEMQCFVVGRFGKSMARDLSCVCDGEKTQRVANNCEGHAFVRCLSGALRHGCKMLCCAARLGVELPVGAVAVTSEPGILKHLTH
jgi:hypothetical protein